MYFQLFYFSMSVSQSTSSVSYCTEVCLTERWVQKGCSAENRISFNTARFVALWLGTVPDRDFVQHRDIKWQRWVLQLLHIKSEILSLVYLLGFFGKHIYLRYKRKCSSLARSLETKGTSLPYSAVWDFIGNTIRKVWGLLGIQVSYRVSLFNSTCFANNSIIHQNCRKAVMWLW